MAKTIHDLSRALIDEKKKSRLAMAKLVDDTEVMIAESLDNRHQLDCKMSAAELAAEKERQKVLDERKYSSIVVSSRKLILIMLHFMFILIDNNSYIPIFIFSETETQERD